MKKIPKYDFNNEDNPAFELSSITKIYHKSKSKMLVPHRQDFFGIFYYTKSGGSHFVDFKEYPITAGSVFIISNEQVHFFKEIDQTEGHILFFTPVFLSNDTLIDKIFDQNIELPQLSLNENNKKELDALFKLITSTYSSNGQLKNELLKRYLEIILLSLFQINENETIPSYNHAKLQRFIQFKKDLRQHYKSHKSVKFYAKQQFTTPKTLNIDIKEITGKNAKIFIDEYIILLAKRLLVNNNTIGKEVAYELGFNEPTNFTKFFKKRVGVSPSKFQKTYPSTSVNS